MKRGERAERVDMWAGLLPDLGDLWLSSGAWELLEKVRRFLLF